MIVYSFILFHEDPMFFWHIIIFKQVKESCFVLAFKQNCIPTTHETGKCELNGLA